MDDWKLAHDIETTGWHVIKVPEDDVGPGFAFTIGLWRSYGHPELIAFGLPLDVLHELLNVGGEAVKEGASLRDGETDRLLEGHRCALRDFPEAARREFLGTALSFYRAEPFPAVQIFWPDRDGRFPWDAGCDPDVRAAQRLRHADG